MIGIIGNAVAALALTKGKDRSGCGRWPCESYINQTLRESIWTAREEATPEQLRAWLDTGPRGTV